MAGMLKHGAHLFNLTLPALAIGSAQDQSVGFVWNGFAGQQGGSTGNPVTGSDQTLYQVVEMVLSTSSTLTGAATNYVSLFADHYNFAGSKVDEIGVAFLTTSIILTQFVPANLNVASGAVVPGCGATSALLNGTGVVLPWSLTNGDMILLARTSTSNGIATPALSLTFKIAEQGA